MKRLVWSHLQEQALGSYPCQFHSAPGRVRWAKYSQASCASTRKGTPPEQDGSTCYLPIVTCDLQRCACLCACTQKKQSLVRKQIHERTTEKSESKRKKIIQYLEEEQVKLSMNIEILTHWTSTLWGVDKTLRWALAATATREKPRLFLSSQVLLLSVLFFRHQNHPRKTRAKRNGFGQIPAFPF